MSSAVELVETLKQVPMEHLLAIIALGALALACWAIYAVHSAAQGHKRR